RHAVERVRVQDAAGIFARGVDRRMDGEARRVDLVRRLHHLVAVEIDLDQAGRGDLLEQPAVGVEAEVVLGPGRARRRVGADEGESPEQAAAREFFEDTGVARQAWGLRLVHSAGDRTFFEARDPEPFDLGACNRALRDGSARSLKSNNLAWVSRELAPSWLGHKKEYETLPWVTEQVMRAIQAGFTREHLARRAFDAHQPFVDALARL